MSNYELAQLNIGVIKEPLESPRMADFVGNLDRINALADGSPGFVWRLQTEEGDEWFERMSEVFLVLWWVPEGHRPTIAEAEARLDLLREHGTTPEAFDFGSVPPDNAVERTRDG